MCVPLRGVIASHWDMYLREQVMWRYEAFRLSARHTKRKELVGTTTFGNRRAITKPAQLISEVFWRFWPQGVGLALECDSHESLRDVLPVSSPSPSSPGSGGVKMTTTNSKVSVY